MSWATPIRIRPDTMWCVWSSHWSGSYEFICGPKKARELLDGGMTKINGQPCSIKVVCEWEAIGAVHLHATCPVGEPDPQYAWELLEPAAA